MDKLIDITDRVPARKRKRKIRTNIKFAVVITIFLLCIFSLLYFQSPYSKIKELEITGNTLLSDDEYAEILSIKENDSMWSFKINDLKSTILENEWVKSVKIKRNLFTTVHIEIEEWDKVAFTSKDNTYYPILANGYIFEQQKMDAPIDAPLFLEFDNEKLRKKMLKQLTKLNPEVLAMISQINATPTKSDPYAIILFMNDGYEVRADLTNFSSKLNYYPNIIAQIEQDKNYEKGIIDIEVGSYYYPYSGEYAPIDLEAEEDTSEEVSAVDNADETEGE